MDYEKLGLKAGIEIHQQLDTKEKLFCGCPTLLRKTEEHEGEFLVQHSLEVQGFWRVSMPTL